MKLKQTTYVMAFINIMLAVLIISFAFIYQNRQPAIVTFDLKATLKQYQSALEKKNIAPTEQIKRITTFSNAISTTTQAYSAAHNVIIIVPNAVIAGAVDRTPEIQREVIVMLKNMNAASSVSPNDGVN
ncbi:TrbI F-type domain-containing protein [Moritella viscosa]|uniref:TrbI F-type domain-containing protein n=1 Tax=Moritella viscosa TaxID=80854 RepID=UPI00091C9D24|nr:TrbI F-type domain-containing protein [Moritella viscosa]SGZ09574.1 Conjugative transfer [Moritella viscosa]